MKNKFVKRILSVGLVAAMTIALAAGCGKGGDSGNPDANGDANVVGNDEFTGKSTDFTWWITQTDSNGEYYENYEENTAVQFINQQYWDVENGGISTEETGRSIFRTVFFSLKSMPLSFHPIYLEKIKQKPF